MIIVLMAISYALAAASQLLLATRLARIVTCTTMLLLDAAISVLIILEWGDLSPLVSLYLMLGLFYKMVVSAQILRFRSPLRRIQRSSTRAFTAIGASQLIALPFLYVDFPGYLGLIISAAACLICIMSGLTAYYYFGLYRAQDTSSQLSDRELPSVSILVPAKDETDELIACLESITELDYKKLEILVLDDCSSNPKTSEIIKSYAQKGVRFIAGVQPDPQWLGKNNAYEALRNEASGDWLLYIGADIRMKKHTLRQLMSYTLKRHLDMVSVLPIRDPLAVVYPISPLRYWWEHILHRGFMGRPAVLSSIWLVRANRLKSFGGFKGVSRSIIPERHIAGFVGSKYQFISAGHDWLTMVTAKQPRARYSTAIRHRYPQLKRRIERVYFVTLAATMITLAMGYAYVSILWPVAIVATLSVFVSVLLPAITHYRSSAWTRVVLTPWLLLQELAIINYSMFRYEFSNVLWKGRNVCLPVMRVYQKLPSID
ncbi:MAG: glycosyltransferase family 2 protein [Patescibacteria group bacterium]